jgi:hypothetical protein
MQPRLGSHSSCFSLLSAGTTDVTTIPTLNHFFRQLFLIQPHYKAVVEFWRRNT